MPARGYTPYVYEGRGGVCTRITGHATPRIPAVRLLPPLSFVEGARGIGICLENSKFGETFYMLPNGFTLFSRISKKHENTPPSLQPGDLVPILLLCAKGVDLLLQRGHLGVDGFLW